MKKDDQQHVLDYEQTSYTKHALLVSLNTCHHTLDDWMHLSVDGISAKSFCPQKTNNRMLFLLGCFQWQWVTSLFDLAFC